MTATYLEFIDANMHRHYPLSDAATATSSAGVRLPDSFLVDARISVSPELVGLDRSKFFISRVTVYQQTVSVELSYDDHVVCRAVDIPTNLTTGDSENARTFTMGIVDSATVVFAQLVVGTCQDLRGYPGVHNFDNAGGVMFPSCVWSFSPAATALVVDGVRLTGDVILEAGTNVSFVVDGNTVTVNYGVPTDLVINDAASFLAAVTAEFGPPIQTVNSVSPDTMGNIDLLPGNSCVTLTTSTNTITIDDACLAPCSDKSSLDTIYTNLGNLNTNYAILRQMYQSMSSNIALMIARLSVFSKNRGG